MVPSNLLAQVIPDTSIASVEYFLARPLTKTCTPCTRCHTSTSVPIPGCTV